MANDRFDPSMNDDVFRGIAYVKATETIANVARDLSQFNCKQLKTIYNIGPSIANHISHVIENR